MDSDEELIARHTAGDEDAFNALVERHLKSAYSFAYRLVGVREEAEDIVQESFLKAWKHIHRYSPESASFRTWFMRIVRNTAIDSLRKKKSIPFSRFEDSEGNEPFADVPDEALLEQALANRYDVARLEQAIGELPLHYREILILYLDTGSTLQEIADTLEVPLNTIKSRYRRGIAALRDTMNPKS